jgi:hypothetical protein
MGRIYHSKKEKVPRLSAAQSLREKEPLVDGKIAKVRTSEPIVYGELMEFAELFLTLGSSVAWALSSYPARCHNRSATTLLLIPLF